MHQDVARQLVVEDHLCPDIPIMERKWYYRIEVEPNVWTDGRSFENVHLTREALRRIDTRGLRCLDIGAMEGAIPILLCRRKAREVVAYDRLNFSERIALLQHKLDTPFEVINRIPLSQLNAALIEKKGEAGSLFDLVIFSGVLYHMFDIIGGLLMARRQVRNGGIVIVETASVFSAEQVAPLNAGGRFMPGDNYWLPTLGCLDTLLRFVRLKPLDALYLQFPSSKEIPFGRVCVPCLAVETAPRSSDDTWLKANQEKDFREYIDWSVVERHGRDPLYYDLQGRSPDMTSYGTADLAETVFSTPETKPSNIREQVHLPLDTLF